MRPKDSAALVVLLLLGAGFGVYALSRSNQIAASGGDGFNEFVSPHAVSGATGLPVVPHVNPVVGPHTHGPSGVPIPQTPVHWRRR